MNGIQHFARLVRETPVGNAVELQVARGRDRHAVEVTVGRPEIRRSVRATMDAVRERLSEERQRLRDEKDVLSGLMEHVDEIVRKHVEAVRLRWKAEGPDDCDDCPDRDSGLLLELDLDFPTVRMTLRSRRFGAELEGVDGQFAEFFGVEGGVLVRSVREDSPAGRAGLRAGDVIVSVGGREVRKGHEVARALADWEGDGKIPVAVRRDGQAVSLDVESDPDGLPPEGSSDSASQ